MIRWNALHRGHASIVVLILILFAIPIMGAIGQASSAAHMEARQIATPSASAAASPAGSATAIIERGVSVTDSVTINLTDGGYDPSSVQATNGHDLHVTLVNTGTRRHAFQIERLSVDVSLAPGERQAISIVSPPLGTFRVDSDAPGDEQFSGTLIFYI